MFKNLTPQARAHEAGAELRIVTKERTKPDPMGLPSRPQLKALRRDLEHNLPLRARAKRDPPPAPLPPIIWEGHEDDEETGQEPEEDLEALSIQELKERLKARGLRYGEKKHETLLNRLREDMAREEENEEEEEGEGEEQEEEDVEGEAEQGSDDEGDEEQLLQELRESAPRVPRSELVEGRAFFCWDGAKKAGYFPMVCKDDIKKGQPQVASMCLMPAPGAPGIYIVDPNFDGATGKYWNDHAMATLIFDARAVTGESWQEVRGGWKGKRAWKVRKD